MSKPAGTWHSRATGGGRSGVAVTNEELRDAVLSVSSAQLAARACLRAMDDFEAEHASETLGGPRA